MTTRGEIAAQDLTRCCFCGEKVSEPLWPYSIEWGGSGEPIELPLCAGCGAQPTPTVKEIKAFLDTEEEENEP